MKPDSFQLRRATDKATENLLLELREATSLSEQEQHELIEWIQETPFAATPTRAWIGEIAANLLRSHANKSDLWNRCKTAQGWQLYFFLLALSDDRCNHEYTVQLRRAATSTDPTIRAFAEESLWSLESTVAESVD